MDISPNDLGTYLLCREYTVIWPSNLTAYHLCLGIGNSIV